MNKKQKEAYAELAEKMDARDRVYSLLQRLHDQGKQIPAKYLAAWNVYTRDTRPWRKQKKVVKLVKKTAKKLARNEKRK